MVVNKWNRRLTFTAFILPALVFYLIFAMLPLAEGLWLSTMTWDGTAPWTPAQMPIADFESKILNKVTSEDDRAFLLKNYRKDPAQGTYMRQASTGIDRYRLQLVIASTGFENPKFHFVGLQNYIDVVTGKADPRFFPQSYNESKFQAGSPLEDIAKIPAEAWENHFVKHINDQNLLKYLNSVYKKDQQFYVLDLKGFTGSELDLQTALAETKGLENDWEALFNDIQNLGLQSSEADLAARIAQTPAMKSGKIAPKDKEKVLQVCGDIYKISHLKSIVAAYWYEDKNKMGVLVFTIFFSFFNVLFVNLIAILLALALDQKLKTKNLLRSIYFIPNILSMIIVAFIWQLIFTQLLPALTGIQTWIMNPDMAPWLTVLVATWQGVGYYTVIYLAGLQNIPQEIVEVASIDGAGGFHRFTKIVMPLLLPAVTICLFLSTAGALKTFDIIFALYPSNSTTMGVDNMVVNIFYDAFRDKNAGTATAKAVLLLLTILTITGIQLNMTKKKEVEF